MSSLHLIAPTCKLLPSTNQEHGNKAIYTVADTLERNLRFLDGDVHSSSRVRLDSFPALSLRPLPQTLSEEEIWLILGYEAAISMLA